MHRVAVIGSGTLDILPHNGAVVTLLAVCGSTHRESYFDIVMVGIVGAILALVAVILSWHCIWIVLKFLPLNSPIRVIVTRARCVK